MQQEAQLPHRNSASAAHVYLGWLTDRVVHRTPQNRRYTARLQSALIALDYSPGQVKGDEHPTYTHLGMVRFTFTFYYSLVISTVSGKKASESEQESLAIAKMTARCALYMLFILILFSLTATTCWQKTDFDVK